MKLTVIDKEAFDQWRNKIIRKLSTLDSQYLDEDRITLLDHIKLDSPISRQNSRKIDVLPTISIEEVIDPFMISNLSTITQRIEQAKQRGNVATTYSLYCHSVANSNLTLSKTLADYNIQEGDLLLLNVDIFNPNVLELMILMTTRELRDFCDMVQSSEDVERSLLTSRDDNSFGSFVRSILLYTDEDTDLAQYIRCNYLALNEMTSHYLDVYTIEQAAHVSGISIQEYWKAVLKQTTYSFLHMMGWTRYKPYNKAEAYSIANMLGIHPDALPCIVIFGTHMNSNRKIVITISGEIKVFFRRLSSIILRTMAKYKETNVEPFANFDEFQETFLRNWNASAKEAGIPEYQNMTFIFEGKTVFINKPSGTLELKDFQND